MENLRNNAKVGCRHKEPNTKAGALTCDAYLFQLRGFVPTDDRRQLPDKRGEERIGCRRLFWRTDNVLLAPR